MITHCERVSINSALLILIYRFTNGQNENNLNETNTMKQVLTLLITGILTVVAFNAIAAQLRVSSDMSLQASIDNAQDGDVLLIQPGHYTGNFTVNKSITLRGDAPSNQDIIIDGNGKNDAIRIKVAHVTIDNLHFINWGDNLTNQNAAIYIEKQASHPVIKNNLLKGRGMGIYLDKSHHGKILNNKIQGDNSMRSADRGNGVHMVMVKDVEVRGNEVWHTRDGLYIITSNENQLVDNYLHDLRYGVHYMYSYTNVVSDNLTLNTRVGYALMQSKFLTITNNQALNSNDHGLLLNFITKSTIKNNFISGVKQQRDPGVAGADGKALFVYNSLFNDISNNWFAKSQIGIHLTAGSEDNKIVGNSFVNNPIQVKYVSNRDQDWDGNYWSNYLGWDSNGDGVGDVTFEPNDGVDKMLWKYPEAKLLMNSPAILTLRWVQREFPVLKPSGIRDHQPLMTSNFKATAKQASAIKLLESKS